MTVQLVRSSTDSENSQRITHRKQNFHFIKVDEFIMAGSSSGTDDGIDRTNRLVKAKTYKLGWNSDLTALIKFVKEQVFYVVVHDFKNESDDPLDVNHGAICQNLFLKKFPAKVTNVHMKKATHEEMTMYLKDLWTTALNAKGRGNIRRELSSEKSAVYAALNEAFRSKLWSQGQYVDYCLFPSSNKIYQN